MPPAAVAGLGAASSIIGGIAGQNAAAGDRGNANNQQVIANDILQHLAQAPDISKPLILEQYRQAGILTPEMEQQINAGPSAVAGIGTDQQSLDAQRGALQQLQQRASGGFSAADRAALNEAQSKVQAATQGKQQQILQQAAAQMGGAGSTGRTLAAELANSQGGANQQASNANQQAQIAAQNSLQAINAAGQLGGQINNQQFSQAAQKAAAADQMNRFNIQNQIGTQQRNVGANNQAQASNLANNQYISNQNVGTQNQELNNQLGREMQQWQGNVGLGQIQAGGAQNYSNFLNNQGNQIAQGYANIGSGVGQSLNSAFSSNNRSQNNSGQEAYGGNLSQLDQQPSNFFSGGRVNFTSGGHVPGQAQVPGDSPQNDTVHAKLSPGEIVVPRSLAESKLGKEMLKLINAHNSVKNKMNGHD